MYKDYFLKFSCPSFTDHEVVLREIMHLLIEFKCTMTECGDVETLERVVFRKSTGVIKGRAVPPKYIKKGFND